MHVRYELLSLSHDLCKTFLSVTKTFPLTIPCSLHYSRPLLAITNVPKPCEGCFD